MTNENPCNCRLPLCDKLWDMRQATSTPVHIYAVVVKVKMTPVGPLIVPMAQIPICLN